MTAVVRARIPAGREVEPGMFWDLTDALVTGVDWNPGGTLAVTFDRELTDSEARRVLCRLRSSTPDEEAARCALADAMPGVRAWEPELVDHPQVARLTAVVDLLAALILDEHADQGEEPS